MTGESRQPTGAELALCAHDLRGALTVIAGYTSLLGCGDSSSAQRCEAVAGIEAAIGRADALLTQVLSGRVSAKTLGDPVALVELAQRAAADVRITSGREVTVTVEAEAVVPGDQVAIARALENLLVNAATYTQDGPIDVTVGLGGGFGSVEVADRGPGIPDDMRDAVLEPFARLERDADLPGTGLGLTVVRGVAERHLGRVAISQRKGGGAVVRLELPVGSRSS